VIEYSRELEQKSRALEAAGEELRRVNRRLTELDRLKDEFISTVSHELRTPLTSIRSFSEILLDNPELDALQRNQFLAIVVKESERLTRLINDILDMSRIDSGMMDWQLSTCDPKDIIEDALAATSGVFREKRITIEPMLGTHLPPVRVDRDRLMQVVINLLSNAAEFVEAGRGRVRLRLAAKDHELTVSVEDNGPGIPVEQREAVFERFRQLGGDMNTGKPKGSGLGLTICRQIIEHFGGRIWVEGAEPQGAVFRFTLPAAPAAAGED
jgi:signal transduction histidine kinase